MLEFDQCLKTDIGFTAEEITFAVGSAFPELTDCDTPAYTVLPGFCDVHVHFREPGFSYKETIKSGCEAAARGGYTAVCTMPNLLPVPDCDKNLQLERDIIAHDACVAVYPYGALTVAEQGTELSAMKDMAEHVIAFSDDGKGVQDENMMRNAMICAKSLRRIIAAHCEVNELLRGGYIHAGLYAEKHGHPGICSESEWRQIERDLRLAAETGCAYHVCHVSTKESVDLIRRAKAEGVDVTCETAPHYLVLDDSDLQEDGRFKMNPPLRGKADREALLEGVLDGTVDMIATDHAPHSLDEKAGGLKNSLFGIVGLETAFPVLYTDLVRPGIISLEKLIELLTIRPRRRFGIPIGSDYSIWDLNEEYEIDPSKFLSMGRSTPFSGKRVFAKNLLTVKDGQVIYRDTGRN